MANIKSFPNNQDEYVGAEWLMKWFHGRTSGVFGANNNAKVSAVQGAMQVSVTDGLGWLSNANADGIVWWNDTESQSGSNLMLDVDMADGVLNRIDRVIVSWQTTNYVALPTISILKGTPSSTAQAPALTNNNVLRQISLARILVNAGITSLTNTLIIDERTDPAVCGIVNETISVDTTGLHEKYEAAVAELRTAIEEAWSGEISPGAVSTIYTATIPHAASAWTEQGGQYLTVLSVPGLLLSDTPDIGADPDMDDPLTASQVVDDWNSLRKFGYVYAANTLVFIFYGIPTVDIPIQIRCVRK